MSGKCEACGVVWKEHLGVQGTCQQLQEARKRHKEYLVHIDRLIRERDEARAEIERLQAIGDKQLDELIDVAAQADWRAGEIERLTTENRTHVATIACVMEQAKSAASVYQTETDGLRAGIAAIAEELNCEQKAGTICSCIRAMQRELNRIGGEHARAISATIPDLQAEIERLRNAIAWLRSNIIPNAGAGQPFAYVWQEKWEQFESMVDGEGKA